MIPTGTAIRRAFSGVIEQMMPPHAGRGTGASLSRDGRTAPPIGGVA